MLIPRKVAHRKQHLMPPGLQPGLEVVHVAHTPRSGTLTAEDGTVQLYPCYSFEVHVVLADIDPDTAGLVEASVDRLAVGRTVIVVAHRPETLARLTTVYEVRRNGLVRLGDEGRV